MTTEELIKALADSGKRESALLLKNWGEMDEDADALFKAAKKDWATEESVASDAIKRAHTTVDDHFSAMPIDQKIDTVVNAVKEKRKKQLEFTGKDQRKAKD